MTFLSLEILGWLVAAAAATWALPRKLQVPAGAVVCALFVALHSPVSLALLLASGVVTYAALRRARERIAVVLAVIGGLAALLVAFKVGQEFALGTWTDVGRGLVPLGMSFYTFRQIHYALEAAKGKLPEHGLGDYLAYLLFLPTFMVGPIHLFGPFRRDLRRRRRDLGQLSGGLERVLYGYAKIVVLGNFLISDLMASWLAGVEHPGLVAYLDCFRYALNLYFQFAGYSDVAIGFALIMGFRVIENFDHPYLARNINDFWHRWHISLSQWCRSYVYTPVASLTRQPVPAILAAMLVLALWHELSLRWVVWGLWHGGGIAVWHGFQRLKGRLPPARSPVARGLLTALAVVLTWNFVGLSFALTKEPDLASALQVFTTLAGY